MAAKDLGSKFVCYKCECKFYDMKKPDPICPKCGADQRESPANRPAETRRSRLAAVPKIMEPLAPTPIREGDAEDEVEEVAVEEEEEEVEP